MTYDEQYRDLFSVSDDFYLAHCISADLAMGKGIAVQFNRIFNMRNRLFSQFGTHFVTEWDSGNHGFCIREDRVFNLITKRNYWDKPTYENLESALIEMKEQMKFLNYKNLAMPKIGCGLDGLEWYKVSNMITDIFKNEDVNILICIN